MILGKKSFLLGSLVVGLDLGHKMTASYMLFSSGRFLDLGNVFNQIA